MISVYTYYNTFDILRGAQMILVHSDNCLAAFVAEIRFGGLSIGLSVLSCSVTGSLSSAVTSNGDWPVSLATTCAEICCTNQAICTFI